MHHWGIQAILSLLDTFRHKGTGYNTNPHLESHLSCPFFSAATTIVEAGRDKNNPDDFAEALDSVLGDFAFPDVFLFDVWGAIGDVKNGKM